MAKKILILNGSPRAHGNTAELIHSFTKGAQEAGHTVTTFRLHGMDIHPCLGCLQGAKFTEKPCAQRDDMDNIYPAYEEADVLVLASPMYFWSITGELKVVIDRLFAVTEARSYTSPEEMPAKSCVLLMAAEGNTAENDKPVLDYYHTLIHELGWHNAGSLIAGGNMQVGDIKGKPELEKAYTLGKNL